MFFILSKLLIYLLSPACWMIGFLIIGLVTKRNRLKKFFLRFSLVLFIIFSNPFLLGKVARWWDVEKNHLPAGSTYSCAIILGGFASEDYDGDGYFNGTSDRFIQAVKLRAAGKVSHILVSGGNSRLVPTDFRESVWVASELSDFNIPDSNILIENWSRNSFENALFSRKILDSAHLPPPYILITSAYHMRRAMYTFRKMDIDVIPFPCNYIAGRGKTSPSDFVPALTTLATWNFYTKEMIGYFVYMFMRTN